MNCQSTKVENTKAIAADRIWIVIGLLTAVLGLPLSAYQQGSYFLFDIRDDADSAKGTAGRIVLHSSIFQKQTVEAKTGIAAKQKKSAFEAKITDFKSEGSDSVTTGIEILDESKGDSETESAFGETKPASSGFFFSY